jgi:hypothetical protein
MNLIYRTHHLYERMVYAFDVLLKYFTFIYKSRTPSTTDNFVHKCIFSLVKIFQYIYMYDASETETFFCLVNFMP